MFGGYDYMVAVSRRRLLTRCVPTRSPRPCLPSPALGSRLKPPIWLSLVIFS